LKNPHSSVGGISDFQGKDKIFCRLRRARPLDRCIRSSKPGGIL
jgi:hypothetical protein